MAVYSLQNVRHLMYEHMRQQGRYLAHLNLPLQPIVEDYNVTAFVRQRVGQRVGRQIRRDRFALFAVLVVTAHPKRTPARLISPLRYQIQILVVDVHHVDAARIR
jgi:hypothetical protein